MQIRASVRATLADIIKRVGVTSIMVTHDQEEAFDLADRVIVFNRCVIHALSILPHQLSGMES